MLLRPLIALATVVCFTVPSPLRAADTGRKKLIALPLAPKRVEKVTAEILDELLLDIRIHAPIHAADTLH